MNKILTDQRTALHDAILTLAHLYDNVVESVPGYMVLYHAADHLRAQYRSLGRAHNAQPNGAGQLHTQTEITQ